MLCACQRTVSVHFGRLTEARALLRILFLLTLLRTTALWKCPGKWTVGFKEQRVNRRGERNQTRHLLAWAGPPCVGAVAEGRRRPDGTSECAS